MKTDVQQEVEKGTMLPLMEEFYTIQGEGYHKGTAAYFIRVGGLGLGVSFAKEDEITHSRGVQSSK